MKRSRVLGIGAAVVALVAGGTVAVQSAQAVTAPTVANGNAVSVKDNSALAVCTVNPGDQEVEVFVVYKKASDTWSSGPVLRADAGIFEGTATQTVEVEVPGVDTVAAAPNGPLVPSTAYDYRCKVNVNDDGQSAYVDSNTKSFTTSADTLTATLVQAEQEVITTPDPVTGEPVPDPNGAVDPTVAVATCLINPAYGDTTKAWVVYKKSSDTWSAGPVLGGRTQDGYVDIPNGESGDTYVSSVLRNLSPGTSYDWRCKTDATAFNTVTSATGTFVTPSS